MENIFFIAIAIAAYMKMGAAPAAGLESAPARESTESYGGTGSA